MFMDSLSLFIRNLQSEKDGMIKEYYQIMSATLWEFGLRIAEKFFLYNEDAQKYAKKILFTDLDESFDGVLTIIKQDFLYHQISYDDAEIYTLFIDAYNKSKEKILNSKDIDYYN